LVFPPNVSDRTSVHWRESSYVWFDDDYREDLGLTPRESILCGDSWRGNQPPHDYSGYYAKKESNNMAPFHFQPPERDLTMTTENRQFISLDEIIALEFKCKNETCGSRIVVRLSSEQHLPTKCPQCGTAWFNAPDGGRAWHAIENIKELLSELSAVKEKTGCDLKAEIRAAVKQLAPGM
jgi:hypothetical protein